MLLEALGLAVGTDEGIKDSKDVAAIVNHAGEDVAELGVALGFAMPFGKNHAGDFDVAPQLVCGMATQEQAVEKGGFALREVEIQQHIVGNRLCRSGHGESAVYRKFCARQVGLTVFCRVGGNTGSCRAFPTAIGC